MIEGLQSIDGIMATQNQRRRRQQQGLQQHQQSILTNEKHAPDSRGEMELTETTPATEQGDAQHRLPKLRSKRRHDNRHEKRATKASKVAKTVAAIWGGIQKQTLHAAGVLLLAIGTSVWWNRRYDRSYQSQRFFPGYNYNGGSTDLRSLRLWTLVQSICVAVPTRGIERACHKAMVARQTELVVGKGVIPPSETVLRIPRSCTIWDVDAVRDPWVYREFVAPKSSPLRELPSTSIAPALLAVYLARLCMQLSDGTATNQTRSTDFVNVSTVLENYLSVLPQHVEDFQFHPLFWSHQVLQEDLGGYTSTCHHIISMRQSVQKEYDALCQTSTHFASQINVTQYQIARLNVMTRSFGSGPWPRDHDEATKSELADYQSTLGVDFTSGSHVMVPLLDQFNHHATPNVGFSYHFQRPSQFVVTSLSAIPNGLPIFDSYGKRTDASLVSKYGFLNGDGSDYTQASLALWHSVDPDASERVNASLVSKTWKLQMLRYLQYDDGYEFCVTPPGESRGDEQAWELKRLKYQHLVWTGHLPQRWTVRMPPRDRKARPRRSHGTSPPPSFDMSRLQFDASGVFSTCRLIVLTHWDYNGQAFHMLQPNLRNASFVLPRQHTKGTNANEDSLEFRTLFCVARMAQTALSRFQTSLAQQLERVEALNNQSSITSVPVATRRDWMIAHVRLGEMQTLEALKRTAYAGLRQFTNKIDSEPAFSMRDDPCPPNVMQLLMDDHTPV